jgi:ribonuclease PH
MGLREPTGRKDAGQRKKKAPDERGHGRAETSNEVSMMVEATECRRKKREEERRAAALEKENKRMAGNQPRPCFVDLDKN